MVFEQSSIPKFLLYSITVTEVSRMMTPFFFSCIVETIYNLPYLYTIFHTLKFCHSSVNIPSLTFPEFLLLYRKLGPKLLFVGLCPLKPMFFVVILSGVDVSLLVFFLYIPYYPDRR